MSEVTLKINNRGYCLSCDEGQEQRLVDLSHYIDSRLKDIAASGAASNESHLFVLTALVLADEIFELKQTAAAMQTQIQDLRRSPGSATNISLQDEEMISQTIDYLAGKIEHIAARIQNA